MSSLPVILYLSRHRPTVVSCTLMACFCVHLFMCWASAIVRLWPVWARKRAHVCSRRTMTCTWNKPAFVRALRCRIHSSGRWRRYRVPTRISTALSLHSQTCYHDVIFSCLPLSHSHPHNRLPNYLLKTQLPVSLLRSRRRRKDRSCVRLFRLRLRPTRRWSCPWTSRVQQITMPLSKLRWPFLR